MTGPPSPRVLGVNVGQPRPVTTGRRIVDTAIWKTPVDGPVRVRGVNLDGDAQADRSVHGGPDKAVYAYAIEEIRAWESELGRQLDTAAFGENLTTEGIDVSGAPDRGALADRHHSAGNSPTQVALFQAGYTPGNPGIRPAIRSGITSRRLPTHHRGRPTPSRRRDYRRLPTGPPRDHASDLRCNPARPNAHPPSTPSATTTTPPPGMDVQDQLAPRTWLATQPAMNSHPGLVLLDQGSHPVEVPHWPGAASELAGLVGRTGQSVSTAVGMAFTADRAICPPTEGSGQSFDDHRHALAAADAHGFQPDGGVTFA